MIIHFINWQLFHIVLKKILINKIKLLLTIKFDKMHLIKLIILISSIWNSNVNSLNSDCMNLLLLDIIIFQDPVTLKIKIKNFVTYKGWEDGTFAASCEQYRYPPRYYYYEGPDVLFSLIIIKDWQWGV